MEFLHGMKLTKRMQDLCQRRGAVDLSIAYWGREAIKLLKVNPKREGVRVLCCLNGGKSDPDVIKKFGRRARQNDRLHAKVIWTPSGALVSSANASSNGMPEEEETALGLIEAGFYTEDDAALSAIHAWFDKEYKNGARITVDDLTAAAAERESRLWDRGVVKRKAPTNRHQKPIPFIDAVKRSKTEFSQQRIAFVFCKRFMSRAESRQAKEFIEKNPTKLEAFNLPRGKIAKMLSWYSGFNIPKNTYLIDVSIRQGRSANIRLLKSFDVPSTFTVEGDRLTYVLARGIEGFNYNLTRKDKSAIRRSITQLWKESDGDRDGRILTDFSVAAPILISNSG